MNPKSRGRAGRAGRGRQPRQERRWVLVATEGKVTEPEYLQLLQQVLPRRIGQVVIKPVGVGLDPVHVVKEAIKHRDHELDSGDPYDHCFCLVDVDRHANLNEVLVLARHEGIDVLVSNPKFEIWLHWHLADSRPGTSKGLDHEIDKRKVLRGKNLTSQFPVASHDAACRRALQADPGLAPCQVGPVPSTALPVLIDYLLRRGS